MSFAIPQRLPDFNNQERRQYENWNHVSRPTRSNSAFTYKDKPFYGGVHPARRKRWYTSKWLIGSLSICFIIYLIRQFSSMVIHNHHHDIDEGGEFFRQKVALDWDSRRERVKEVFIYSWKGYVDHAWGKDEYRPISGSGRNMIPEGMHSIINKGC